MSMDMNRKSIPAFDLRPVVIDGETVDARPIQWDGKDYDGQGNDENGNPLTPTVYMTVCPKCGQGLQFNHTDIIEGDKDYVACTNCGVGEVATQEVLKDKISEAYQESEDAKPVEAIARCPKCDGDKWVQPADRNTVMCAGCGLECMQEEELDEASRVVMNVVEPEPEPIPKPPEPAPEPPPAPEPAPEPKPTPEPEVSSVAPDGSGFSVVVEDQPTPVAPPEPATTPVVHAPQLDVAAEPKPEQPKPSKPTSPKMAVFEDPIESGKMTIE